MAVYRHDSPVARAGATPGYSASPSAQRPSSSSAPLGSGSSGPGFSGTTDTTGTRPATTTAFLGDNYTAGAGAPHGKSWVDLVEHDLDLDGSVFALRGGGYARPDGADRRTYRALLSEVVADKPQLVVVSGGRNDVADDPASLSAAAADVFDTLHAKLPDATLVAIAPWWGDSAHPEALDSVDTAVRDAVTRAGGTYLDLADPLVGPPEWMAAAANPNASGHAAIAKSVEPALRERLPPSG